MRLALISLLGLTAACSPSEPVIAAGEATDAPRIVPAGPAQTEAAFEAAVASVNPLENDLRGLDVAVRLPEAFAVKPGGAVLTLKVTSDTGGLVINERFGLAPGGAGDGGFMAPLAAEGFTAHRFVLDPNDYDRMAATQTRMREVREAAPGQNELEFDTQAATCVIAGKVAPDVYTFSVFVRSAPSVDYVSFGGDMEIYRDSAGELAVLWDDCPA